jgi:micrococcal nuclease
MNNVTRFPRKRRAPVRGPSGPWDGFQKPKAVPLWTRAVLAFAGAVVAAQIGIWQFRDYAAAVKVNPEAGFDSLFSVPVVNDQDGGSFGFCHEGGGYDCVVDGDTLYYRGTKIRIADIDTPETHEPRCAQEAALGDAATKRLHALVNAGPFSLQKIDREEDVYGRKLRILTRSGESLGETLVDEGLARWYEGGRQPWC